MAFKDMDTKQSKEGWMGKRKRTQGGVSKPGQ